MAVQTILSSLVLTILTVYKKTVLNNLCYKKSANTENIYVLGYSYLIKEQTSCERSTDTWFECDVVKYDLSCGDEFVSV